MVITAIEPMTFMGGAMSPCDTAGERRAASRCPASFSGHRASRNKIVGAREWLCCFYLVPLHHMDEAMWLLAGAVPPPMATAIAHQTINSIRI